MTRIIPALCLALVLAVAPRAEAGRIGGPAAEAGVLQPGQSVVFDIAFAAGQLGNVTVMGNGASTVELAVYDGDGNVLYGSGAFERRVATFDVTRAGFFRVEVVNTGSLPSILLVGTN